MKSKIKYILIVALIYWIFKRMNDKVKILDIQKLRSDKYGHGHFGASRGNRLHQGIDLLVTKGDPVYAPISGILNFSIPYGSDTRWQGFKIINDSKEQWKVFYCSPIVKNGVYVNKGDVVAYAQSINDKYGEGMLDHLHVELRKNGVLMNPQKYLL